MYKELIKSFLDRRGADYTISGNEIKCKCLNPEHEDSNPSFSINYVNGFYNCFSCGFKGHVNNLLDLKIDEDSIRLSKYLSLDKLWEDNIDKEEPPSKILLPPVDHYIEDSIRGIPKELIKELGIYYCTVGRYSGRLIIPIKDKHSNLLGFDARIYGDVPVATGTEKAKYLRPSAMKTADCLYPIDYLWNHRDSLDLSTIVLVEGIFDAISYIALGIPALCNFGLGSPTTTKIGYALSLGAEAITNGFDNDQPAIKAWQGDIEKGKVGIKDQWRKYIRIGKAHEMTKRINSSGFKDANEYLENITRA